MPIEFIKRRRANVFPREPHVHRYSAQENASDKKDRPGDECHRAPYVHRTEYDTVQQPCQSWGGASLAGRTRLDGLLR